MGHAVLINNLHSESEGSRLDTQALDRLYRNMGFKVHLHQDCTDSVSKSTMILIKLRMYYIVRERPLTTGGGDWKFGQNLPRDFSDPPYKEEVEFRDPPHPPI